MKKRNCWIHHQHLFGPDEYECSVCGEKYRQEANVCPNCGSRMGSKKTESDWVDEAEYIDSILED